MEEAYRTQRDFELLLFPHVALKLAPVFRGYAEVNQSNEGKTMEVMTCTSLASEVEKGGPFLSGKPVGSLE